MITATERINAFFQKEKVNINKNNFNSVLTEFSFRQPYCKKNTLANDGSEESINLSFKEMTDFEPEQVARQYPNCAPCWQCVISYVIWNLTSLITSFRRELENILKDPALSDELREELSQLAPKKMINWVYHLQDYALSVNSESISKSTTTVWWPANSGVYASLWENQPHPVSRWGY